MSWDIDKSKPADIVSRWLHDYVYSDNARALRVTLDTPFSVDSIFREGEYSPPDVREGLLIGGIDNSDAFKSIRISDDGRLLVDSRISLSITELEIEVDAEDGDSVGVYGYVNGNKEQPTPLSVTEEGVLRVVSSSSTDTLSVFGEVNTIAEEEVVVVTYTVGANKTFTLLSATASAMTDVTFYLRISSNNIDAQRTAWTSRNVKFDCFSLGLPVNSGDTIEIIGVAHKLTGKPMNARIYGEEL